MSSDKSEITAFSLPRIPAFEAPEGKWCIGFLQPVTELPDSLPAGCIFEKADTAKQTVKLGGKWWEWNANGKSLVPFSDNRGWVLFPGKSLFWGRFINSASAPDEVAVIPSEVCK